MTLVHPDVHNLLARSFLCAWQNLEGDPDAGASNRHGCGTKAVALQRGVGRANVQSLVLTSDGRVLHAVSGYISPEELGRELRFALETAGKVRAAPLGGRAIVRDRIENWAGRPRPLAARHRPRGALLATGSLNLGGIADLRRVVTDDQQFVHDHALLPVSKVRTRMLTRGKQAHFGYGPSSKFETDLQAPGVTQDEFARLSKGLRTQIESEVGEPFADDASMLALDKLSEKLAKRVRARLTVLRKQAARKARTQGR